MIRSSIRASSWNTSAFGDAPDTSPMELSALKEHLVSCRDSRGSLFALHCVAESMNGFMASRLVTTLVAFALLIGVAALVL